jgi:hypothetical protein
MRRDLSVWLFGLALVAAGCGSQAVDPPVAVFDGNECSYEGPTEFVLNSEVEFFYTNFAEGGESAGFQVTKLPEGTTVDEIVEQGLNNMTTWGQDSRSLVPKTEVGVEYSDVARLDIEGLWVFDCFATHPPTDYHPTDYPATLFTVSG